MEETETLETETVEETVETPAEETSEESTDTTEVDVGQLQATNKKLYERAKKAEADLKALKGTGGQTASSQPTNVEETVLRAQGVDDELIDELKLRAPSYGGSLIKAQKDPKYIAVKENFEKDQKQKAATLGASRGAGQSKAKKDFNTPGLTRDEHRKMVLG